MYHILEKLRSDPAAGSVVETEQKEGPALGFPPSLWVFIREKV